MQFVDGKPRYFATTVLCVLLIWPTEPFLTSAFLMCLTKCIHFMQLADLVVASKIVNGKYQHFYISFLVQVFNNREIANNSCVKGKSSINECSSCITGNDRSLRLRLGNSPRLQPGAFVNSQFAIKNWSGETWGVLLLIYMHLVHAWDHIRKSRVCLQVAKTKKPPKLRDLNKPGIPNSSHWGKNNQKVCMQDSMLRMTPVLLEATAPDIPEDEGFCPAGKVWLKLPLPLMAILSLILGVLWIKSVLFFSLSRLPWSDHDAKNLITAINTELE